jgi:hypothetical protein
MAKDHPKIIVGLIGRNFEAWVPKVSKNSQTILDSKYALVEVFSLVYVLCKAVDLFLDVCDARMGYVFHKHTAATLSCWELREQLLDV